MKAHAYSQFEDTPLWRAVGAALDDLEANRDLALTTDRRLVIGFLVKSLSRAFPASALSAQEIVGVHNAINEVCNGVQIEDADFETRLGISRAALARVLEKL